MGPSTRYTKRRDESLTPPKPGNPWPSYTPVPSPVRPLSSPTAPRDAPHVLTRGWRMVYTTVPQIPGRILELATRLAWRLDPDSVKPDQRRAIGRSRGQGSLVAYSTTTTLLSMRTLFRARPLPTKTNGFSATSMKPLKRT